MTQPAAAWLLAALLATPEGAARADQAGKLGRIDFPTSGTAEAQAHFVRGVLLLHSFEYEDAAEEFGEAERIDPEFAMAFWGEAMTHNHPIWMERDREGARAILARLAPTPEGRRAKAPTRREKMYVDAVETLYADGDKKDRDLAYADAMRRLHEEFPDDLDAASFYALALLGTSESERDVRTYIQAAAVVEEVFAKNPEHPGAAHYLIHCYDDPVHAPLGMRAARVYATIAPSATHALHMPSHIFLASGMWDEVVSSNEASWKASVARAERKKLAADAHSFHALLWLGYAYLQQGRYADARGALALARDDAEQTQSARARGHLAAMRAAYVVETGEWKSAAARERIDAAGPSAGVNAFVEGLVALETGNRDGAQKALDRIGPAASVAAPGHAHGGPTPGVAAGTPSPGYDAGKPTADAVLRKELEARILFADGKTDEAIAVGRQATALEDAMTFEFGPPDVVKPSHELLGEMLLSAGRPAEARAEFEVSLSRAPRRAASLLGLARAESKAGVGAAARETYAELARIWNRADADVTGLAEVRRGAASPDASRAAASR